MIQTSSENLLAIPQVPSHLEKLIGKRPHIASIYRWMKRGIAGVRLETVCIGGTRCTSAEALDRFFQESTKARERLRQSQQPKDARLCSFEQQAEVLEI